MKPGESAISRNDWCAKPLPAAIAWGLPLLLLAAALLAPMPKPYESIANVIALAWMAVACALNARRCGRLHCFITAPVFALAAIVLGLAEFGAIRVGGLGPIVTLAIASALSAGFVLEVWQGAYRRRGQGAEKA